MRLLMTALALTAMSACGGSADTPETGAQDTTGAAITSSQKSRFSQACPASGMVPASACDCILAAAERDLNKSQMELIIVSLSSDDAAVDALVAKMSVADAMTATRFSESERNRNR